MEVSHAGLGSRVSALGRDPVLLVDDHEPDLLALGSLLEGIGADVVRARSGAEALGHVCERDFAVVLLDVRMPGMDGFQTASRIRGVDRSRATPIVFLTAARDDEEQARSAYRLGAVDYVEKPVEPDVLRSKVSVFLDLFRGRRREAAARAELERSNRDLDLFAHMVAHDLAAPLRGVSMHLGMLAEGAGAALTEEARAHLDRAVAAAESMKAQVRDALAFARVGAEPFEPSPVDLEETLRRVLANLHVAIDEAGAQVTHAPLPTLRADPVHLTRLLQNLVENAVKFRGERPPRVHVAAERRGERWVVSVADDGIGIDPTDAARVLEGFCRLHPESYLGTGLGLAISRRIAERHGGSLWVESRPGAGSTFFVALPQAPSARAPAPGSPSRID